jgi:excisionase family DNA binding protein
MDRSQLAYRQAPNNGVGQEDRLLTIREVAQMTGLSVGTLYHFCCPSQGRIPVVRLSRRCIRFRLSALHAWWDRLEQEDMQEKKR